jgi:Lrp/AsnC family transcriptional regulator
VGKTSDQLDAFDLAILSVLQRDASLSIEQLADRINLSRNACWRRVKRLEDEGIIRKKVALLDPATVNVPLSVIILVRTNQHGREWAEQFRKAVSELPEIMAAYRTSGDIDYVLYARVPDVAAYDSLYQKLITRITLSDVSASFVMEELKSVTELPMTFV